MASETCDKKGYRAFPSFNDKLLVGDGGGAVLSKPDHVNSSTPEWPTLLQRDTWRLLLTKKYGVIDLKKRAFIDLEGIGAASSGLETVDCDKSGVIRSPGCHYAAHAGPCVLLGGFRKTFLLN
ncbi:hypothetical protein ACLOJK_033008 [Asimina triloba]